MSKAKLSFGLFLDMERNMGHETRYMQGEGTNGGKHCMIATSTALDLEYN